MKNLNDFFAQMREHHSPDHDAIDAAEAYVNELVPLPFMHIDLTPANITHQHNAIQIHDIAPTTRMSYKNIDFKMDVAFTDDLDIKQNQEDDFLNKLQTFLQSKGINSALETFE